MAIPFNENCYFPNIIHNIRYMRPAFNFLFYLVEVVNEDQLIIVLTVLPFILTLDLNFGYKYALNNIQ